MIKIGGLNARTIAAFRPLIFAIAHKIVSETIGLRLKIIVAITTYAPADRFFRIELSRVFEATIVEFQSSCFLPNYI